MSDDEAEAYYRGVCYRAAQLIRAGCHPDLFAKLTPRQVHDLYFHPVNERTKELVPPAASKVATDDSLADELLKAEMALALVPSVTPEQREKILELVKKRHAENASADRRRRGGTGRRDRRPGG